jgi:hypothetical protein
MRPRIRTLKPELWADEKVGELSHGARLLFLGMISMADDEGRLRELPAAIIGHVFPYDSVSTAKLTRWLAEVERSGMVTRYEVDGNRYVAFPHWSKHQKVDRPTPSDLPPPPTNSTNPRRAIDESSSSNHRGLDEPSIPTRRRAVRSDPIRSDPAVNRGETKALGGPDADPLPDRFPAELRPHLDAVLPVLVDLAARHGANAVRRLALASTMMAPPRRHKPFVRCAFDFAAWADSKAKRRRDVLAGYRNWLDSTDDLAGIEPVAGTPGGPAGLQRPAALQRMDAWRNASEYRQRGAA